MTSSPIPATNFSHDGKPGLERHGSGGLLSDPTVDFTTKSGNARIAVVFAWARRVPTFALPGDQDRLIEEVAAVNPHTIVVLNTSQPVALPWAGRVQAILEMWWPGDEGGWATGKLLLGKVSPAGRLPVTWGRRLQDYPATDPLFPERSAEGVDHRTIYSEGVNIGYRWFDHQRIEPLFPFGFGLSYTWFEYSALRVERARNGDLRLTCTVRNAGHRAGDEVPQAYLGAPEQSPPGATFPTRKLVAFDRIHLAAGQSKTVQLIVPLRQLQYWSTSAGHWMIAAGKRTVSVGSSSRTLPLQQEVRIANDHDYRLPRAG